MSEAGCTHQPAWSPRLEIKKPLCAWHCAASSCGGLLSTFQLMTQCSDKSAVLGRRYKVQSIPTGGGYKRRWAQLAAELRSCTWVFSFNGHHELDTIAAMSLKLWNHQHRPFFTLDEVSVALSPLPIGLHCNVQACC